MSKNYIYTDYVNKAKHTMGGFPTHPIQKELFLRGCIARSAEHMTDVEEIAKHFMKYSNTPEFITAIEVSGQTTEFVARHMAGMICKFVYHGIEDVMLVKYQGIMQSMGNPDEFWGVVKQAYREKMSLDSNPSVVGNEVAKHENELYVKFITEQFNGDDLKARNEVKAMVVRLMEKKPLEPLSNMPFEGVYDVFHPKNSIFPLSDTDVSRYNASFKAEGFPSEFLEPVGIKWTEYVTFSAGGDRTNAVNTLVRVLRGEGSREDYQTFEGIANVADPAKFYAELVGISHLLGQTKFNGISDPLRNFVHSVKTGSVDAQSDEVGFHPLGPIKNLRRNPFHHYTKDVSKSKLSDTNVSYDNYKQNVETFDLSTNNKTDLLPMGGIMDLNDPRNLYNTIRKGDPSSTDKSGFHPFAPLNPKNIHRVLQKKDHKFDHERAPKYDEQAISDANIDRIMKDEERRQELLSANRVPPSPPSIESMHYETSSASDSVYSSPESDFGTTSTESLPVHNMGANISTTILGQNVTAPILPAARDVSFRGKLHPHLGLTHEHLWSESDLHCLHKAMNILLLRMSHDDRCAVFECFISAIAVAKKEVMSVSEHTHNMPEKVHQLGIFHAIEDRDPRKSYLTVVPSHLNAVEFMSYVMSATVKYEKSHVAILKKLMEALQEMLRNNPSRKAHSCVKYLAEIRRPTMAEPHEIEFHGIHPALVEIDKLPPLLVIGFLYHCIALLCNYSIYAYNEFKKIEMASVFVGLPLSVLKG